MKANNMTNLDAFEQSYIAAALWSSFETDEFTIDDINQELLAQMTADCSKFYNENRVSILYDGAPLANDLYDGTDDQRKAAMAGHDFWLTRCGHGAGFWDGDWPEPHAQQLTDASEAFGNVEPYAGDDGKVYA